MNEIINILDDDIVMLENMSNDLSDLMTYRREYVNRPIEYFDSIYCDFYDFIQRKIKDKIYDLKDELENGIENKDKDILDELNRPLEDQYYYNEQNNFMKAVTFLQSKLENEDEVKYDYVNMKRLKNKYKDLFDIYHTPGTFAFYSIWELIKEKEN